MDAAELARFYASGGEHERLRSPLGELEFARTLEVLSDVLPAAPARILDIGGGTGPYARVLAARGYEVHLLDLAPVHVEKALELGGLASARVGDARRLPWQGGFADAVLLLGPLYHLPAQEERRAALLEARRVLKRGGVLCAAAISRYASLMDGMRAGYLEDEAFRGIVLADLDGGLHRNPTGDPRYFVESQFLTPAQLETEIGAAGFVRAEVRAVQGLVFLDPRFDANWALPELRAFYLEALRRTDRDAGVVAASPHVLATARTV